MSIAAGSFNAKIRFEKQTLASDDGYGNVLSSWASHYACSARILPQFGKEAVSAGRLNASTVATLMVRRCAAASAVTAADRVIVTGGCMAGRSYQIRSIVETADRTGIEMVLEEGAALG